jgi:DNA-binding PadR family transcriptional regulator
MSEHRLALSKDALYILGIIADGPINPYTICKLVNHKRRHFKSPLPLQTVYSVVKALQKKSFIRCRVISDSRAPARTSYSITPTGREALKDGMLSFLVEPEDPFSELQVALMIMGYLLSAGDLDKDTALGTLRSYRQNTRKAIATGKRMLSEESGETVADYVLMGIKNSHRRLRNDLTEVDQLIDKLEQTSQWHYSRIPFWRSDIVGRAGGRRRSSGSTPVTPVPAKRAAQ